ncbi:MAG: NifU family protein [Candidatus Omnitrophota bacterium]
MNAAEPSIEIKTEFTPNPRSLKFNVNRVLLRGPSVFAQSREEAVHRSPLAASIFALGKVESVLVGRDFVTVTRAAEVETWGALIGPVTRVVTEYCARGGGNAAGEEAAHAPASTEVEQRILGVLEQYVRPAVQRDGGDVVFRGFAEGTVRLTLQGACSTCPSAIATLKSGIEKVLSSLVPEVQRVEQA